MAEIRIERISKTYPGGKAPAVRDVSLTVADSEFMVLLGPSGCGKTTLLRMIAGLEYPDAGRIFIGDRDVTDLPPRKRGIAMVFQSYAVFPHLTVFENIAFGLRMQKRPNAEVSERVERAASLLQLEPYLQRYPAQLSGGQRQRVAVARAIVMEPVGAADGRAAQQPRRAAAPAVPRRAQEAGRRGQDDHRLRHPRSGRGAQPGRPHRRDARGPDRPGRRADGGVRSAGRAVRRRLHRQPADELPAGLGDP